MFIIFEVENICAADFNIKKMIWDLSSQPEC